MERRVGLITPLRLIKGVWETPDPLFVPNSNRALGYVVIKTRTLQVRRGGLFLF